MSMASRSRRKGKRMQARKLAKIAKKALYKSYGDAKRKNAMKRAGRTGDEVYTSGCEREQGCGNVGCFDCHPSRHNLPKRDRREVLCGMIRLPSAIARATARRLGIEQWIFATPA